MKGFHLILLLLLNCGWAALPAVVSRLEHLLEPREFIFLRYGLALAAMVLVWPWLPGRIPRGMDLVRAAVMGVAVFTLGHLCQIAGMQRSQASDAAVLLALDPLVSSLGAALFLHEPIPGRRWVGFILAMVGVVLMSLWRPTSPLPGLVANVLIVLSFVSEAVWSVQGKPLVARWGIPKVTAVALAAGTLANGLLLVPDAGRHAARMAALTSEAWLWLAFLGVVLTAIGYSAWYLVIRDVPVSVAAMTIYLQPLVGTLLAVVLAGEPPHAGHAWGSLAIAAGVFLGIRNPKPTPRRGRKPSPGLF